MLLDYLIENDCSPSEVNHALRLLLDAGQKALAKKPFESNAVCGLLELDIAPLLALCAECAIEDDEACEFIDGDLVDDDGDDDGDGDGDGCDLRTIDDPPFVKIDMGDYVIVANASECHVIPKDGVEMERRESKLCPDDEDEDEDGEDD